MLNVIPVYYILLNFMSLQKINGNSFLNLKKSFSSTDIKLILVVFTVLTIGFFSLYLIYDFDSLVKIYQNSKNMDVFFTQDFDDNSMVFLLGSSQVGALDTNYIEEKLSKAERQRVELPRAKSYQHNIWDAIGIGLHFLKRR